MRMPIDIVPLNQAPAKLRLKIFRDSSLYAPLLSEALSEAMDIDPKIMSAWSMHHSTPSPKPKGDVDVE